MVKTIKGISLDKKEDFFWNEVLSGKKIISDKEAEKLYYTIRKLRKDKGFRI